MKFIVDKLVLQGTFPGVNLKALLLDPTPGNASVVFTWIWGAGSQGPRNWEQEEMDAVSTRGFQR